MNPLEQVKMCQNYIIVIKLHHEKSRVASKSKTGSTGRISELEDENLTKNLYAPRAWALRVARLSAWFWGTSRHPNWAHDSSLEIPGCIISNPSGIFQFGVHFPLQKCILPRLLPVCPKRGSEVIFCMFFNLLGTQNLPKFLVQVPKFMICHEKSKTASHFSFLPPNPMRRARRAVHWAWGARRIEPVRSAFLQETFGGLPGVKILG